MTMHLNEARSLALYSTNERSQPGPVVGDVGVEVVDDLASGMVASRTKDNVRDVTMRLDPSGFITDASDNAVRLGIDPSAQLLLPHIADLAAPQYQPNVASYLTDVASGKAPKLGAKGIKFPLFSTADRSPDPDAGGPDALIRHEEACEWVLLTLHLGESGPDIEAYLVGTLQLLPRKQAAACETSGLFIGEVMRDPFTGLADRRFFARKLTSGTAMEETQSLALFAIDGMRAIFMQHGQGTADEVRWGFARFLEAMIEPHHILGQVDDERFGVIIPGARPRQAREWAADALATFAGLTASSKGCSPRLSASAGIARAKISAQWTIRQAELGLVMARAAGGMQTAICRPQLGLTSGHAIEEAVETLVDRTLKREVQPRRRL